MMKVPYELTVIISNYNQERHLSETIDSVLAQKVNFPFQIIITDDFSCKDRSKEIIQEYADQYEHIEPIFANENGGYLTNILRAKAKAKTKYICLLDADDYWTDRNFLRRAYHFLETHRKYSIYECNVEVISEDWEGTRKKGRPFISPKAHRGTYSKEMFLNNEAIPITQTTGMFLRNSIFIKGIPEIMSKAVGTRSERAFEGDTGRFIMHLKEGLAYYDDRIVGVYRLTKDGIWNRLSESQKRIISARMYVDYDQYYGSNHGFFANRVYRLFQGYLLEKQKEFMSLKEQGGFVDENERLMAEDVYRFCKKYEKEIIRRRGIVDKLKMIYRTLRILGG